MERAFSRRNFFVFALLLVTLFFLWRSLGKVHVEAVTKGAEVVASGAGWVLTNSILTNWIISLALIFAVRRAIGPRPALVPGRSQSVLEILVSGLQNLLAPIVGRRTIGKVFPLLLTLFVFILIHNWSGLLPGVGSISYRINGEFVHLLRPTNADLNGTLALALISFGAWIYFVFRYAGPREFVRETFGNKADKKELSWPLYWALGLIFIGVGLIDLISILFRVVSLSFRLYGNVFGGENLLPHMTGLCAYLLPVPFYLLELLIGFIQALVFTLLSAVYIGLLTNHEEA